MPKCRRSRGAVQTAMLSFCRKLGHAVLNDCAHWGCKLTGSIDRPENAVPENVIQGQVRDKLAAFEISTLRIIAITVCILFTIRIVASFAIIPFEVALTISAPLGVSILVSLCVLIGLYRGALNNATVRPITTLLITLITFNVFYILHTTENYFQFFFATLLLAAFGLAAPTFFIWLCFVVPFFVTFIVSLFVADIAIVTPYVAALIGGTAISTVAYFVRIPTIRKLTELEVVHSLNVEKLEQSNKAKDQFLANMTHELRTPLTGVIGMIDLLADTELTELQRYYLGTTRRSTRYLLTVINDILDMSKLEAGKLTINLQPMDAAILSNDIASLFDIRVQQKGLKLQLNLPDEPRLPVVADGVRISQILLNLLENALKFTDEGTITISLEANESAKFCELTWRVSDTGSGIPADRLPKLFDRFEQVDSSSTRTTSGTGLGLAIVRDLVALMGGDVGATSVEGQGSEFWFTLDVATCTLEDLPKTGLDKRFVPVKASEYRDFDEANDIVEPDYGNDDKGLRILFAEDNHINLELIRRILRREGWSGTAVNNGQEAVDAVKSNPVGYDLILMDIQMPVLDGLSALKIIKTDLKSPPPIIALTANTLAEDMQHYVDAGFDAIVGKPIDMRDLRAAVEKVTAPKEI